MHGKGRWWHMVLEGQSRVFHVTIYGDGWIPPASYGVTKQIDEKTTIYTRAFSFLLVRASASCSPFILPTSSSPKRGRYHRVTESRSSEPMGLRLLDDPSLPSP